MTALGFLAEWALRSSVLILSGGLLLWAVRVKSPSIRLATWVALLCGSMAMPLFLAEAPRIPVVVSQATTRTIVDTAPPLPFRSEAAPVVKRLDWARAALDLYGLVSLGLLLRLGVGLAMARRLLRASRTTGEVSEGIAIRESDRLTAPVTLGLVRPAIVLPSDWREWSASKLEAVLAHERSHVRRFDPAVQVLSAIHRALLWHSPMSWFLHNRIVRVAEEASDDAALAVTGNRAMYAEVLLGFLRLGVRGTGLAGVPMARYGRVEPRINRILDGTAVSRGLTKWGLAAILALASPLTYVIAATHADETPAPQVRSAPPAPHTAAPPFLRGLGTVAASQTVVVAARIDGLLKSVHFQEGERVEQGQLLASLDSPSLENQSAEAQDRLVEDMAQIVTARRDVRSGAQPKTILPPLEIKISEDQAEVNQAKLRLDPTEIKSPITGVAGFRMVDPGNVVHPGQPLVVVTQVQPAAVLFTIPEDELPRVRRSIANGAGPVVEAWNRNNSVKIASGHLAAIDNQIDEQTGTAKLKAVFDNKDGALFPGQFVNARLVLNDR